MRIEIGIGAAKSVIKYCMIARGRQLKRYSVRATTLCYDLALQHNAWGEKVKIDIKIMTIWYAKREK